MRVWYDCEFLEDGSTIELISIGMVAEDGRELYLINRDAPWQRIVAHEWLADNVVPHLPVTVTPLRSHTGELTPVVVLNSTSTEKIVERDVLRDRVQAFLDASGPDLELWAWYGAYDHVALAQLFGRMIDLPAGVPMWTNDLRQEQRRLGDPPVPGQTGDEHHALADARWLRDAHRALTGS